MGQEALVRVASNRKDDRVALFERDERHPGGEAFVAGAEAVEVYPTPRVKMLLAQQVLVEVTGEVPATSEEPASPGGPMPLGRIEEAPVTLADQSPQAQTQEVLAGERLNEAILSSKPEVPRG